MPAKAAKRHAKAKKARPDIQASVKPEVPRYSAEPLNPWLICGPDTTVTELWKVRERSGAATIFHLIYLDRYGWYCEHGRNCAAVPAARRAARDLADVAKSVRRSARSNASKASKASKRHRRK